ncbi:MULTISPECIES: hypothetical protein [Haloarcula]|uniref:hypothetical protein n=1 Tax=Haloarcula TaxID=2237 RepID=UPI0013DEE8A6|nr:MULTISPECIES: hypothetical protein [Haloarcula]NHX41574.1 hypothetical protein [Haloarcula sp. R1-2]
MSQETQAISPTDIFEEWNNPEEGSPCHGCERRDKHQVKGPWFGHGDHDADIMILAADPGGSSSVGDTDDPDEWYNQKRYWKDYPGTEEEIENYQLKGEYSHPTIEKPKNIDNLPALGELITELEKLSPSVYYTNVAKCSHINSAVDDNVDVPDGVAAEIENRTDLNEGGKKHCAENFLLGEIEYIDPDVIIAAADGSSHMEYVFDFFSLEKPESTATVRDFVWETISSDVSSAEDVIPVRTSEKIQPPVVPIYHFNMMSMGVSQFLGDKGQPFYDSELEPPKNRGKNWYFDLISECVSGLIET